MVSLSAEQIEQPFARPPIDQNRDLVLRVRLPQGVQEAVHGGRVVEGGVGGRITGQKRVDLLIRARLLQVGQQQGHGGRVVEGGVGGGALGQQRGGLVRRARQPQLA